MKVSRKAGLRSDGELVQALADTFDFATPQEVSGLVTGLLLPAVQMASTPRRTIDEDHGGWIEILDVSTPTRGAAGDPEDDGLPHTIIWCIDGNGTGSATGGEEIMITYEIISRTWSVDGEIVDDAGMSALLWL